MPHAPRAAHAAALSALLVAVVLVFARGFANGATRWDDDTLVFENPVQRSFGTAELARAFDPRAPRQWYGMQYAPLSDVSYALDRRLFGDDPRPYHAQGLLFHVGAAIGLYFLAVRLGATPAAAALAGALFALHPLQVEPVTWISGRRTAMAGFFMVLAMLAWRRARFEGSRAGYVLSIVWALHANLSKQSAVVIAPLLAVIELVAPAPPPRPRIGRLALAYLPHLAITAAFFAIALVIGGREHVILERPGGGLERAELALALLRRYAGMIVWPAHLLHDYRSFTPTGLLDLRVLGGAAVLATLLAAVRWRARAPLLAAGSLIALVAIVPGIAALAPRMIADRYAYVSLAGAGLAAAHAFARLARWRRDVACWLALGVVLALSLASFERVGVWADNLTLLRAAAATDPANANTRLALGTELVLLGDLEGGKRELRAAIALATPIRAEMSFQLVLANLNLGYACERTDDLDGAERALDAGFEEALAGVRVESWLAAQGDEVDKAGARLAAFHVRHGAPKRARPWRSGRSRASPIGRRAAAARSRSSRSSGSKALKPGTTQRLRNNRLASASRRDRARAQGGGVFATWESCWTSDDAAIGHEAERGAARDFF